MLERRLLAGIAAGFLVVLAVGTGAAIWKGGQQNRDAPQIQETAANKGKDTVSSLLPADPVTPPESEPKSEVTFGDDSWQKYKPKAGGFQISFPQEPAVQEHSEMIEGTDYWQTSQTASVKRTAENELGYSCDWNVTVGEFGDKELERRFLIGTRKGFVNVMRGKLIDEKEINTGGFLGLEFTVQGSSTSCCCRSYIAGKRKVFWFIRLSSG